MTAAMSPVPQQIPKMATAIDGFDERSHGGLPRNRLSLLKGGPGSGKTVFALQSLVNGARRREESGVFVAFEESTRQILANAARRTRRSRGMVRKVAGRGAPDPGIGTAVVMVLYIAEGAPNSTQAVANLQAICDEHLKDKFRLEIVDVLESPQRALADGILVTPSLAKVSPSPTARIVGNLSNKAGVLLALGIADKTS